MKYRLLLVYCYDEIKDLFSLELVLLFKILKYVLDSKENETSHFNCKDTM